MISISEFIIVYLTGGLTFLPILICAIFAVFAVSSPSKKSTVEKETKRKHVYSNHVQSEKSGWIRLEKVYKPVKEDANALMSYISSSSSKRQKEFVYAKLKYNTLFIHESDVESEPKTIIPVHNYNVSIYPKKENDQEIYGKSTRIRLVPKNQDTKSNVKVLPNGIASTDSGNGEFYITCARPVDKEDWYFSLLLATYAMSASPETSHIEEMDITHFDQEAMKSLISTLTQDVNNREIQWLNAILGRLFLGIYKTREMEELFKEKILKKIQKVKLPSFLGEISVEKVDIGQSIPFITQPKLLSMTDQGDMLVEANVDYTGGLKVVIKTDLNLTYSPISLPLVLSVTLKSIKGKFQLKAKPPPTNRLWFGFCGMPEMDWEIAPAVSDTQITITMVRNAIQSKIREFIKEVLVLPNMDDISFYDSKGKGGIFGERVPKTNHSQSLPDIILNKTPELIVTNENLDLKFNTYSPSMRKAEPTCLFDTQNLQKGAGLIESNLHCGPLRARGYSSPELHKSGTIQQQTNADLVSSPKYTSNDTLLLPSTVSRTSYHSNNNNNNNNAILRKRHSSPSQNELLPTKYNNNQAPASVTLEKTVIPQLEEDLRSLSDSENTVTDSDSGRIEPGLYSEMVMNDKASKEKEIDSRSISERSTMSNNSSKSKLLSRFSGNIKYEKTIETKKIAFQNKKKAFYNMAGNMFKKNNGVSRQIREERNRELEEMHQRKMMNIFEKDTPPPLPPRTKSSTSDSLEDSSLEESQSSEEYDHPPISKEFDISDFTDSKIHTSYHQIQHGNHRFSL